MWVSAARWPLRGCLLLLAFALLLLLALALALMVALVLSLSLACTWSSSTTYDSQGGLGGGGGGRGCTRSGAGVRRVQVRLSWLETEAESQCTDYCKYEKREAKPTVLLARQPSAYPTTTVDRWYKYPPPIVNHLCQKVAPTLLSRRAALGVACNNAAIVGQHLFSPPRRIIRLDNHLVEVVREHMRRIRPTIIGVPWVGGWVGGACLDCSSSVARVHR